MSSTTPNLGLFKYNTSTDGKEVFSIQNALNNNWDIIDEKCGSGKNIGEIVVSTLPLTDAGLHLLDGSLIDGNGSYSQFVTYISGLVSGYSDLFTTEASWQEAVTNYGVCGKFVYDSTNNAVRLPKVTGIIEGTTDLTALGDLVEAGLPNITGGFNGNELWDGDFYTTGCFTQNSGVSRKTGGGGDSSQDGIGFDASLSNSIYGNSSTVQPQTVKVLYYIVIATSTKTAIEVDIDEIATDLNGKVDKSDLQECQVVVETFGGGYSWYRVYSDGWCEQGGWVNPGTTAWYGIALLKVFTDNKYTLLAQNAGSSDTIYTTKVGDGGKNTTSTAYVKVGNANTSIQWIACGYIEV